MESVRKDIECTFGCLKARFRWLWRDICYHNPKLAKGKLPDSSSAEHCFSIGRAYIAKTLQFAESMIQGCCSK